MEKQPSKLLVYVKTEAGKEVNIQAERLSDALSQQIYIQTGKDIYGEDFLPVVEKEVEKIIEVEKIVEKKEEAPAFNKKLEMYKKPMKFQVYYQCPLCNKKGKAYKELSEIKVQCGSCGKEMLTREVNNTGYPDSFGNHFYAGTYKQSPEEEENEQALERFKQLAGKS